MCILQVAVGVQGFSMPAGLKMLLLLKSWSLADSDVHSMPLGRSAVLILCRFLWAQKGPSMLHAVTMTLVGLKVALLDDWSLRDFKQGRNELVSAFLALELAYLFQARTVLPALLQDSTASRLLFNCLNGFACLCLAVLHCAAAEELEEM